VIYGIFMINKIMEIKRV